MNTEYIQQQLTELEKSSNLRKLIITEKSHFQITQDNIDYIDFSSNDYLGIATNTQIQQCFLKQFPLGTKPWTASSSRLLSGNNKIAIELEQKIAADYKKEAALVLNSGYHVNIGILPAITNTEDLIIADKLVHASLIDGMRLSSAKIMRYKHNDLNHLESLLKKYRSEYRNVFLVTESVFSMDGDKAPLQELIALKKQYKLSIYLDEAHAVGVFGKYGLGLAEQEECLEDIDILVGTFGKAIASVGAFVVSYSIIREWLVNTMRPLIFSTALPPINISWTLHTWKYMLKANKERNNLKKMYKHLVDGLNLRNNSYSHILPIPCENAKACFELSQHLRKQGFLCLPIRHPTVPKGSERVRISLQANIPEQEIIRLNKILKEWL